MQCASLGCARALFIIMADGSDIGAVTRPAGQEDGDPQETKEWLDSLEYIFEAKGPDRASLLLNRLEDKARAVAAKIPNATFFAVPGGGHVPQLGARGVEMDKKITEFLRQYSGSQTQP